MAVNAMGNVVWYRPLVPMLHKTLSTIPPHDHQIEPVLISDQLPFIADSAMLIDVLKLKSLEVGFSQAMQLVMFPPKAFGFIPWHCDQQSVAMLFECFYQLQALIQMLDYFKSNDGVKLTQLDFKNVIAAELGILMPFLLTGHINNDGVIINAQIIDIGG
jgi:hypothetical protein